MLQQILTILIVDDSEIDRETYRRYLHRIAAFDYTLLEADSGEAGLTLYGQTQPDIVLLDYLLPDLNGLEFLTTLKAAMGDRMPPLIMMTGQGNEAIAVQAIKAGAEDYLVKGQITPSSLQHSIEQAVEKAHLRHQLRESKERLQLALKAAQMGTWEWRSPGNELFCSDQVSSLLGLPSGTVLPNFEAFWEQVCVEDRELVGQAVRQAFQDKAQCSVEFRVTWPDGSIHWLNGKGQFYPEKQSGRLLGTVTDITAAKQAELEGYQRLQAEKLVMQIAQSVPRSLDSARLLQTIVDEVRQYLQTDRVVIFHLQSPNDGVVLTESTGTEWISICDSPFYDPCLASRYLGPHKKGRIRSIDDIYAANLAPCYIAFLESLQVKASLVVPIPQNEGLWGLLIAHHCRAARQWQPLEIRLLEQLASQISLITQQSELYEQMLQELQERQRAEASYEKSEARFQRAIALAPFPIFVHAEDGQILQISQATSEASGYAANELKTIGDWTERAYGERQEPVLEGINQLYDLDQRVDEGEFEIRTKHGETRTWLFSSAPLGHLDNGARLVISMAADVTAQKQAEAALVERLQQATVTKLSQIALSGLNLQALFDQACQLTARSLNVDACAVFERLSNDEALRLRSGAGWDPDSLEGAIVGAGRHSQAGYTLLSQQPVVVKNLQADSRFEGSPLLIAQGMVSSMSTIISDHSDRSFGVLSVYSTQSQPFTQNDINFLQAIANLLAVAIDRKRNEQALSQLNLTLEQRVHERTQALEDANQELEAFSYSVAHDLRAPLRAIQGFAEVLGEDYGTVLDELGTEYIHRMAASAENLDLLIQDLLTYSRLGRTEIQLQQVSLATAVKDTLANLEPTLKAMQARIEVEPDLPIVCAQNGVLRQLLSNLIGNALKFVAPGVQPQIRIWAQLCDRPPSNPEANPQYVQIWVADNGIGIAPQHQARIFNPFERLHGVDAYPGTGIGLAIVKRGVQRMGGRFGVESALGQGSRFWLELETCR